MANKEQKDRRRAELGEIASLVLEKFKAFPTKIYTVQSMNASLGGGHQTQRSVKEVMYWLAEESVVVKLPEGKFQLMSGEMAVYEGVVDMLPSGFLYVVIDGQDNDVFVTPKLSRNALNNDRVKVRVTHTRKNGTMEGEILEVVERSARNYVGVVEIHDKYAFVKADNRKMPIDIFIPLGDDHKLENHHKVSVHVTEWTAGAKHPVGEIVNVFGFVGDNDAEMHAILAEYNLPYHFEKEIEEAAERISDRITAEDYASRRDCRGIVTFTIDPADAKDFDDAISVRKLPSGNWEIGVHIADVTHYVTPGSIVDTEGENRATSVYLVDRTVPMLPEKLSNNLCSLRPNEEKLCFSAIFEMDNEANILGEWFGRTVILSDRRFTYAEAQDIIETGEGDYKEEVLTLNTLAQIMRAARFSHGSIYFEREEAKFDLDEKGRPQGVSFKVQKESNQLVEEFMLLANKKVAEFVGKKRGEGANAKRTFIYRVHDKPNSDKLARFTSFVLKFGYYFKAETDREISRQMNKLMGEIKGKSEENLISTLAIRTMAKAYYTTENIGHYGLAFPYYTHFTSPIRRYPDMMVHRLLAHYLDGGHSADKETYERLCEHSSEMEVRASEAERASIKYKMVEFMLDKVGEEFDGHISGVTDWGFYVELDDTHIEGLVSVRDLSGDYFAFNVDEYAIIGERTGMRFTLGDAVRVQMLRGDLARKQMDFGLTGELAPVKHNTSTGRGSSRKPGADKSHGGGDKSSKGGGGKGRSRSSKPRAPKKG